MKIEKVDVNKIVDDVRMATDMELVLALSTLKSFLDKFGADCFVPDDVQQVEHEISRRKDEKTASA